MPSGYSGTPLVKKLGIKPGMTAMPVHEPDHYFDLLGPLPGRVKLVRMGNPDPVDFIHLFAKDEVTLHNDFPPLMAQLKKKRHDVGILDQTIIRPGDRYRSE